MPSRRSFLAGLAVASLPRIGWAEAGNPACIAAGKLGENYVLNGLTSSGESVFQIPLPTRGHAAAAHPTQAIAVAFARRPGAFALVLNCLTGTVLHTLAPPQGRQFNGHGVFSADGSVLLTSEVVAVGSEGRIGIWDSRDFRRIGEWGSGGIGPHDLKQLPNGQFVVANGGIQTDPDDRTKLNVATMRPNLTVLSDKGQLVDQVALDRDLQQNSIRHLALLGDTVAFAMQWEGDPAEPVPQLGLWSPGGQPRLCAPTEAEAFAMQGYAGSIAASPADNIIALTSAPAGVIMLFDAIGLPIATHARADISGVAALSSGLVATDGQGGVWRVDRAGLSLLTKATTAWDNHLVPLT